MGLIWGDRVWLVALAMLKYLLLVLFRLHSECTGLIWTSITAAISQGLPVCVLGGFLAVSQSHVTVASALVRRVLSFSLCPAPNNVPRALKCSFFCVWEKTQELRFSLKQRASVGRAGMTLEIIAILDRKMLYVCQELSVINELLCWLSIGSRAGHRGWWMHNKQTVHCQHPSVRANTPLHPRLMMGRQVWEAAFHYIHLKHIIALFFCRGKTNHSRRGLDKLQRKLAELNEW